MPKSNSTEPHGPIIVIGLLSCKSPDNLTGAWVPNLKLSACKISTWVCVLYGPKTLTPSICPLGHLREIVSAYGSGALNDLVVVQSNLIFNDRKN